MDSRAIEWMDIGFCMGVPKCPGDWPLLRYRFFWNTCNFCGYFVGGASEKSSFLKPSCSQAFYGPRHGGSQGSLLALLVQHIRSPFVNMYTYGGRKTGPVQVNHPPCAYICTPRTPSWKLPACTCVHEATPP